MSVYFVKGKGWRYDFTLDGTRYTNAWFETKAKTKQAEAKRKEEILNPKPQETPTVMGFLELVNRRLDHVKAYNSESHYQAYVYMAKRWVKEWGAMGHDEISEDKIQSFVIKRSKVSPFTANREIRYLRALFNFGVRRKWILSNPAQGIPFLPVEKRMKYVPPKEDVLKVILAADPETQEYLWVIKETMGRMSEINRLTWTDVNLEGKYVILYTRKKKGGHLSPRKIPMTGKLFQVLSYRYAHRNKNHPWVFWHRYWGRRTKEWIEGPYKDKKRIMKSLCKKAKVRYFRYHALRHFGASVLDNANVNIGAIQRILGHENRTTTEIYLHSVGESEREAMNIYERLTNHKVSHKVSHKTQAGIKPG